MIGLSVADRSPVVFSLLSLVAACAFVVFGPPVRAFDSFKLGTIFSAKNESYETLCPITLVSAVDGDAAQVGDKVEAVLKQSLQMTATYNAPPGSLVIGKVTGICPRRTQVRAFASGRRILDTDGCIEMRFDRLECPDGSCFAINASLAKYGKNEHLASGHIRAVAANSDGQIVRAKEALSLGERVRNIVGQNAIALATVPLGPASLIAAPVALGAAGLASPSFVNNRPVEPEAVHPRLRGFIDGVVDGLPFGAVVQSFTVCGDSTRLLPGDELMMSCIPVGKIEPQVCLRVHGVLLPAQ